MSSSFNPLVFEIQYDNIVGRLQIMIEILMKSRVYDPESIGRDITIFLDDMVLRLKLWAADVQVDKGSLRWAARIEPVAAALQDLLYHVDQEIEILDSQTKSLLEIDDKGNLSL